MFVSLLLFHRYSPGQNTGVGSLALLQGIFPTQGWSPGLPHCRRILYQLSHKRSPRTLEWVAFPFSRDLPDTEIKPTSPVLAGRFFTTYHLGVKVTQLCLTLCNPMDCSLTGSSIHGIFQARILEWVAISFSRDLPNPGIEPRSPALQADSLPAEPQEKPEPKCTYLKNGDKNSYHTGFNKKM